MAIKKYNLALRPLTIHHEVTKLAQQFSGIADHYLLGSHSLAHITLYQFRIDEKEILPLWKNIITAWDPTPISLTLTQWEHSTYQGEMYWISLIPDHTERLHQLHQRIAQQLAKSPKQSFDPHMTLCNTKIPAPNEDVTTRLAHYTPLTDQFVLTLGACDPIGQLTDVIYQQK